MPVTAASFPEYPSRPAAQYPNKAVTQGLTVAVVPLDDAKEQQRYFNLRFQSKGFRPVFLVMDNDSSTDSFILRVDRINFADPNAQGKPAVGALPVARSKSRAIATNLGATAAGFFVPGAGLVSAFATSHSADVQQNLLHKALRTMTLAPGKSSRGFVYVPVVNVPMDKSLPSGKTLRMTIPILRAGTDEVVNLDVTF